MDNLRCLIANIPELVLADIVHRLVDERPDVDVVARDASNRNLRELIKKYGVDVLIMGLDISHIPEEYIDIMELDSDLVVIGLIEEGRHAMVLIEDIGLGDLKELINLAKFKYK